MLVKKLIYVDRSLSAILSPPMPTSDKDRLLWIVPETPIHFPGPVLARWNPPTWVKKNNDVFWLSENVTCSQRGYFNEDVYTKYLQVASVSFEDKSDSDDQKESLRIMRQSLSHMAFDFLVTILTPDQEVAAGCVVELRPALNTTEAACLYISTLCTNPNFRRRGLACQLVHAVYTLGTMLLEQNNTQDGIWHNAIPSNKLLLGLHVRHKTRPDRQPSNPDDSKPDMLLQMYASCGLEKVSSYPVYSSFTSYSRCEWEMGSFGDELTPMMQEVSSKLLYQDHNVAILRPTEYMRLRMYHAFPMEHREVVQESGILYKKHNNLVQSSKNVYTPETITFSKTRPANAYSFCINVQYANANVIELKISVPCFFSSAILDTEGKDITNTHHNPPTSLINVSMYTQQPTGKQTVQIQTRPWKRP